MLLILALPVIAWAQESAVIAGRVVDEDGVPLHTATVFFEGSETGVLSDEDGRFRIERRAPVERGLRVQLIGFADTVAHVALRPGDSVFLAISLRRTPVFLTGAGYPPPDSSKLEDALNLIPTVLSYVRTERLLAEEWLSDDSLVVWVPWAARLPPNASGFPLHHVCERCEGAISYAIEGRRRYEAASRHLLLGATVLPGGPDLSFCIAAALPGDVLYADCAGSGRTVTLHFAQLPDGRWVRDPRSPDSEP